LRKRKWTFNNVNCKETSSLNNGSIMKFTFYEKKVFKTHIYFVEWESERRYKEKYMRGSDLCHDYFCSWSSAIFWLVNNNRRGWLVSLLTFDSFYRNMRQSNIRKFNSLHIVFIFNDFCCDGEFWSAEVDFLFSFLSSRLLLLAFCASTILIVFFGIFCSVNGFTKLICFSFSSRDETVTEFGCWQHKLAMPFEQLLFIWLFTFDISLMLYVCVLSFTFVLSEKKKL
jgi:hypothetical protein